MKFGDSVIFTEMGKEYIATVLSSRTLDNHMGANDEPLLSIGFFKAVTVPGPNGIPIEKDVMGTSNQYDVVQFRIDVAHESHEFGEKIQLALGKTYPGGRWKEIPSGSTFRGSIGAEDETEKPLPLSPAQVKAEKAQDKADTAVETGKSPAVQEKTQTEANKAQDAADVAAEKKGTVQ